MNRLKTKLLNLIGKGIVYEEEFRNLCKKADEDANETEYTLREIQDQGLFNVWELREACKRGELKAYKRSGSKNAPWLVKAKDLNDFERRYSR